MRECTWTSPSGCSGDNLIIGWSFCVLRVIRGQEINFSFADEINEAKDF